MMLPKDKTGFFILFSRLRLVAERVAKACVGASVTHWQGSAVIRTVWPLGPLLLCLSNLPHGRMVLWYRVAGLELELSLATTIT